MENEECFPSSWVTTTVSDIGVSITGNTPATSDPENYGSYIPFVKPPQLINGRIGSTPDSLSSQGSKIARIAPPFSILVSCIGNLGKVGINKTPVAFNQQINAIVPFQWIEPAFLFYQAQSHSFRSQLEAKATATTISIVNKGNFETIALAIAPLQEQHRIVAKIEELFSELDKGIESLKTAQAQLKVYRQALLKHAFEGKLTAQWRADNPDKLETADALLKRIQKEREQRYQQQVAEWEAAGKTGSKPKAPKPLPPLTAEELAGLPELPKGWVWLRTDEIIEDSLIGLDRGAKDQTPEPPGIPYVKMNNVSMDGHVFTNKLVFIQATNTELNKYALKEGDVLFNTRNSRELVGKSGIVRKLFGATVYNNNLMRIRVSQSVDPLFLSLEMTGGNFKKVLESAKKGTTNVAAVYAKDFFPLPVAVACLNEQKQVVEILESKLSESDQLDQTLTTSLQHAAALRQSILKKAFSGQLVPQDPIDEPASALLARIKAEQSAAPKATKARK